MLGRTNSPLLDPKILSELSPAKLSKKLKPLFADDGKPANCTLDRLEERSEFVIEISKILIEKYDGKVENLLKKSRGYLVNKRNGLYELLKDFEAFSDPLLKKSTIFIQLAIGANLFKMKDPESIEPVIDYHKQRLLLRTGCVEVLDKKLKILLQNKEKMDSDKEVREASVEAVRLIGKIADKDFFEIDEILWSLGRSCCQKKMLCVDGTCNKNPCTFSSFMDIPSHDACIFEGVCRGYKNGNYRKYWEPQVDTHYY